jgi:hypothetical protein
MSEHFRQNRDRKFDLQLSAALVNERRLAEIFGSLKLEKIELKTESWLWERTGNIVIEFRQNGKPSGIATTEADVWIHELKRDGETLCYLMFPIERLKSLCRDAYRRGDCREGGGDDGRFCNILLKLSDILR